MPNKTSNDIALGIVKAAFTIFTIVMFVWFLNRISPVITYVLISLVLVILGQPVKSFLREKLKLGNLFSTILVMFLFVTVLAVIILLFIPLLIEQGKNLSVLNTAEFNEKISSAIEILNDYLQKYGIDWLENFSLKNFIEQINFSFISGLFEGLIGMLSNLFIGFFSVLFITFFLLKDKSLTSNFIFKWIPATQHDKYLNVITNIKNLLAAYLSGLLLQITILFFIYNVSLHLIGVQNATIIAFLSALLNLIPYVGPLISLILMIVLSITSQLNTMDTQFIFDQVKYILIMFTGAQLFDNYWTQPFIYSRSVKSHPLEIFLVILIAAHLFGILGMIIAVPAYTVIKILFREFYNEYKHFFVLNKPS